MSFKEIAEDLLDKEDYDELLELCNNEIEQNPNNPDGYKYKIYCLDDKDEIIEYCDKVLALKPDDFDIHQLKVESAFRKTHDIFDQGLKDISDLTKYYDDLISRYPNNPDVYIKELESIEYINAFRCTVLAKDRIISLCNKILELDSTKQYVYMSLGDAYYDSNDYDNYDKALEYYKKYVEIEPLDFNYHYKIACCIAVIDDYSSGIKYFDDLISRYFDKYEPYYQKLRFLIIHHETENYKAEIKSLIYKLLEFELPQDEFIYANIASAYILIDDEQSALIMLNKALEFDNDSTFIKYEIERIKSKKRAYQILVIAIIAILLCLAYALLI